MNIQAINRIDDICQHFNVKKIYVENDELFIHKIADSCALSQMLYQLQQNHRRNTYVTAEDVWLLTWIWSNGEILSFPISQSGHVIAADTFWLDFYPFLKKVDRESWELSLEHFVHKYRMDGDFCFFGGFHQFGHFMMDIVPRARMSELAAKLGSVQLPPLISTDLHPWERDIVDTLLPEHSILPVLVQTSLMLVGSLTFAAEQSIRTSHDYVRKKVTAASETQTLACSDESSLPELIYLSRGRLDRAHRVLNYIELDSYAQRSGFKTLAAEAYTISQLIFFFRKVKLVIAEPYTPLVNFMFFAPPHAKAIQLAPEDVLFSPGHTTLKGGFIHLVPYLDRIYFSSGTVPDKNGGSFYSVSF